MQIAISSLKLMSWESQFRIEAEQDLACDFDAPLGGTPSPAAVASKDRHAEAKG